jgi:hypothetical protein
MNRVGLTPVLMFLLALALLAPPQASGHATRGPVGSRAHIAPARPAR